MALLVLQVEEIAALLRQVPAIVDRAEGRRTDFHDAVLKWLKEVEQVLENNRLPHVSRVASFRAQVVQATRGQHDPEVPIAGRPTRRRIRDATASFVLQRAAQLVFDAIRDRLAVFAEAERIAQQIVAIAEAKGYLESHPSVADLARKVAGDSDLVSPYTHLKGLVGLRDVSIFLGRAMPGAA